MLVVEADDLHAVLNFDTFDNLRQLLFTLQPAPSFRGGDGQLEYHQFRGVEFVYYASSYHNPM